MKRRVYFFLSDALDATLDVIEARVSWFSGTWIDRAMTKTCVKLHSLGRTANP